MNIEFKRIHDFDRGILYDLLRDAYSYDSRNEECWGTDWQDFDGFFFDNPEIADKCGFITTLDDKAIGFVSWDPRNIPEYVQIGHNCLDTKYKGNGYGRLQMQEAINRIKQTNVNKIIVTTNGHFIPAQRMYESVGFLECGRRVNVESEFAGEYIDYEMVL